MSVVYASQCDKFSPPSDRAALRPADDAATVARAQAGDPEAFDALHARYQSAIYHYLYRLRLDPDAAHDLTQDTFLKAYLNLAQTSADLRFGGWLYRIATNVFLDDARHRKLVQWDRWDAFLAAFHPAQVAPDSPERDALRGEDAEEVRLILERMRPQYRTVLVLREFRDLSYTEIARLLTTTRASVKSLLFRARDEFGQLYARGERRPGGVRDAAGLPKRRGPVRVPAAGERPDPAHLADRRRALGLTQKGLARIMGCSTITLQRCERADRFSWEAVAAADRTLTRLEREWADEGAR